MQRTHTDRQPYCRDGLVELSVRSERTLVAGPAGTEAAAARAETVHTERSVSTATGAVALISRAARTTGRATGPARIRVATNAPGFAYLPGAAGLPQLSTRGAEGVRPAAHL